MFYFNPSKEESDNFSDFICPLCKEIINHFDTLICSNEKCTDYHRGDFTCPKCKEVLAHDTKEADNIVNNNPCPPK